MFYDVACPYLLNFGAEGFPQNTNLINSQDSVKRK